MISIKNSQKNKGIVVSTKNCDVKKDEFRSFQYAIVHHHLY